MRGRLFLFSVEVPVLFRRERVDLAAPGGELALRDGAVDLFGDVYGHVAWDARQAVTVRDQPAGAQGLDGEGHVHDLGRVAVARREVDEAPLGEDVDLPAVLQGVGHDVAAGGPGLDGHLRQAGDIDFAVEVAGVAADGAILHREEILAGDDAVAAGHGDEEVAQRGSLAHLHHAEAIHYGLHGPYRIDLGDNYLCAQALGAHRDALAAPAVAGHDHGLAGHDEVRGTVNAVPDRLPGAVAVVEEMLALGVVDQDHRYTEPVLTVETLQAQDAGGSLLAAADDVGNELRELRMQDVDEVAAVIDNDVRAGLDDLPAVAPILLRSRAIPCEDIEAGVNESGGHVVLGGEGVAPGDVHLRAAGRQDLAEVRGLVLEMHREGYFQALEGPFSLELVLQAVEQRHVVPYPFDFQISVRPQGRIPDFACHSIVLFV